MNNKKYYYKVYGLTIASDYEFHQFLPTDETDDPDIEIEYGGISEIIIRQISEGAFRGVKKNAMWFYNRVGIFWIHDLKKINFIEYGEGTLDDAALFLPGTCLSILLWFRKMIMIHGSCMRIKDRTVIIAGNSGAGKSTLTTELIKRGALMMADDVTGIMAENGEYVSYPAFPVQKLCLDQVDRNGIDTTGLRQIRYDLNKYEIPRFDKFYNEPAKVDSFFRVEVQDVEKLSMCELVGAEKIKAITDSIFINWMFDDAFRFEPDDMIRCIGLANKIKMYKICRNKEQNTLQDILNYIESNL